MASQVRQNFHADSEKGINEQINKELYASYVYLEISTYFDRDDVALPGFHKFFKEMSDEEREHAYKLVKYINRRGGRGALMDVKAPTPKEWTAESAFSFALHLEKQINEALLKLHAVASKHEDPHLTNFIEEEFLEEQVDSIKKIADHLTNIVRNGPGLGVYQFERLTLKE